jgi:hypothetical protein
MQVPRLHKYVYTLNVAAASENANARSPLNVYSFGEPDMEAAQKNSVRAVLRN